MKLWEDLCGRDARAPGWASSHDRVTPTGQECRSILAPVVVVGGPSVLVTYLKQNLFHSRMIRTVAVGGGPAYLKQNLFHPRMIRPAGRGPDLSATPGLSMSAERSVPTLNESPSSVEA